MSEENTLYVHIDESGILQKNSNINHKYFVISLILTDDPKHLTKIFKRARLKIVKKHKDLEELLRTNKEIKGSEITEKQKKPIYLELIEKCNVEFGIIVVDTIEIDSKFKQNSARAFNYLLKLFFSNYKNSNSNFTDCDAVKIFIDDRNVATKAMHTLREYLNTALILEEGLYDNDFEVVYSNSKNMLLIQLSDYVANTTYRSFHAISDSKDDALNNIELIKQNITCKKFFEFGKKQNT